MQRHGDVPTGGSRRDRGAASNQGGKQTGDGPTSGPEGRPKIPDNVFRLFPESRRYAAQRGPAGDNEDPVGLADSLRPDMPDGHRMQPDRPDSLGQAPSTGPAATPGTPPFAGQPPVSDQPAQRPAWADHPITKALEALYGPGGLPNPAQVIADSLYPRPQTGIPSPDVHVRPPAAEPVREQPQPAAEAQAATQREFWDVWLKYQDQLRKQCLHMMAGNIADAEDALSNAMVRAAQKFGRYSGDILNEKAWLSKLVHNVCIDEFRQRKRTYYQAFEQEDADTIEEAMFTQRQPTPEEATLVREQLTSLETCLDVLSSNLRVPLMLRCVEGWSYLDIADELNLRADTVRKRVQLARDFLKQQDIY